MGNTDSRQSGCQHLSISLLAGLQRADLVALLQAQLGPQHHHQLGQIRKACLSEKSLVHPVPHYS